MKTILNRIALGVILLVVVLFSVDKAILGHWYIAFISFVCFALIISYISTLEKKDVVDKKVKIIGWICFLVTVILGWLLIISFPEIFNTYGL